MSSSPTGAQNTAPAGVSRRRQLGAPIGVELVERGGDRGLELGLVVVVGVVGGEAVAVADRDPGSLARGERQPLGFRPRRFEHQHSHPARLSEVGTWVH